MANYLERISRNIFEIAERHIPSTADLPSGGDPEILGWWLAQPASDGVAPPEVARILGEAWEQVRFQDANLEKLPPRSLRALRTTLIWSYFADTRVRSVYEQTREPQYTFADTSELSRLVQPVLARMSRKSE